MYLEQVAVGTVVEAKKNINWAITGIPRHPNQKLCDVLTQRGKSSD
jgi:hypothetical protein